MAVPRRTRARAAAGVSKGCRKVTSGEQEDFGRIWTIVFFGAPPPSKKKGHERQITVFPKHPESYQ